MGHIANQMAIELFFKIKEKRKNYFTASFCKNGILGGAIIADEEAITYRTGKVTIPDKYKKIEMKYKDIVGVEKGRILFLPTVSLQMNNGEDYKFIVFSRKRFFRLLNKMFEKSD